MHIEWIEIPGGEFVKGISIVQYQAMGIVVSGRNHTSTLPTFYISRYPFTCEQYTEYARLAYPSRDIRPHDHSLLAKHPYWCSWQEANAICEWLGGGVRLPTSNEWEKAARGTDGRIYPWGSDWQNPDTGEYYGNVGQPNTPGEINSRISIPVDAYPEGASPYGVLDMIGNGYEWTQTWISREKGIVIRRGSGCQRGDFYPEDHYITNKSEGGLNLSPDIYYYYRHTGFRPVLDPENYGTWKPPVQDP